MTRHRFVETIGRVLLGLVFVHALLGKLTGFGAASAAISARGLPLAPVLLGSAMLLLAAGSLLLISGWRPRLGALLLLIFLIPTSLIFHGEIGDRAERIQLLKNLAIIGGLVLVANQQDPQDTRSSATEIRALNRGG